MATKITQVEIAAFQQARLDGKPIREAARIAGRQFHSGLQRYDPIRKPKASPAPELEEALAQPIELALSEILPSSNEVSGIGTNLRLEAFPKLLESLRGLVSQVLKAVKQGKAPVR